MRKNCAICGLEFDARNGQKTCGGVCRLAQNRERKRRWDSPHLHPPNRQCIICGGSLPPRKSALCSPECGRARQRDASRQNAIRTRDQQWRDANRDRLRESRRKWQRENREWANEYRRRRTAANQKLKRCIICNADFLARKNIVTCSRPCWEQRDRQIKRRGAEKARFKNLDRKREAARRYGARLRAAAKALRELGIEIGKGKSNARTQY